MRQLFAASHALLAQLSSGYYRSNIGKQETLDLFGAIEQLQRHAGGFDPWSEVDDTGLPFMQALLRADRPLPLSWLEGWRLRNGVDCMFQCTDKAQHPVNYWMEERLLPSVTKDKGETGGAYLDKELVVAQWLVENSPDWDSVLASAWVERMASVSAKIAPKLQPLLEACRSRGIALGDQTRIPERWLSEGQLKARQEQSPGEMSGLLDAPVQCLSGRTRPLRELLGLRHHVRDGHEEAGLPGWLQEPSLPELPHRRRDALAKQWVLDPDISLDRARARLWACMREKPEVLDVLREMAETDAARADRIDAIVLARDPKGRTFGAFLGLNDIDTPLFSRPQWQPADELVASDGAGLIEQCLAHLVDSAPYKSAFRWSDKMDLDEEALGPAERRNEWIDAIIDHLAMPPYSHGGSSSLSKIAAALPDDRQRVRLEQAIGLNSFIRAANVKPHSGYPDAKQTRSLNESLFRMHPAIKSLLAQLQDIGLVLNLGTQEWRQWQAASGLDKLRTDPPSWMDGANRALFKEVCEVMDRRSLECEFERNAPLPEKAAARRAPRL